MTTKILLSTLMLAILAATSNALIESPSSTTYNGTVEVLLTANGTQESISFSVTDINDSCSNCSELNRTLNLSNGNYTLTATSVLGNDTVTDNVSFSVLIPVVNSTPVNETNETTPLNTTVDFTISIVDPKNITYNASIPVKIIANTTVDSIAYAISDFNRSCNNCSLLNNTEILANGSHTLVATARLGNLSKSTSITFTVFVPAQNQTNTTIPRNETGNGTPKYTAGLNKLPQLFESGNITDSELAKVIRDNQLNPGVLNRLIKSGMLGNHSITAIIESQEPPKGIFRKFFSLIGIHLDTPKDKLVESYNLTIKQQELIVEQPDVSKKNKELVKQKLSAAPEQVKKEQPTKDTPLVEKANKPAKENEVREQKEKPSKPEQAGGKPEKANSKKQS